MGYGLGKIAKPITSGAKALGNIALTSSVNLLDDVLSGKSVKQAAKTVALEGANVAKMQTVLLLLKSANTADFLPCALTY